MTDLPLGTSPCLTIFRSKDFPCYLSAQVPYIPECLAHRNFKGHAAARVEFVPIDAVHRPYRMAVNHSTFSPFWFSITIDHGTSTWKTEARLPPDTPTRHC